MGVSDIHRNLRGKIGIRAKASICNADDLAMFYTPGVAGPCREIAARKELVYELTMKGNTVAIISDGTRVLGLGDIGPEAALPVMEGKALIMKQFAGIDAFPICLAEKDPEQIISTIKAISPVFGAINLEDIETPKVFDIEKRLTEELDIPIFHDDQHGTAIVVLAGLINALKIIERDRDAKIGLIGAGSAGYGVARLLKSAGFKNLTVFDSNGAIHDGRENLSRQKKDICGFTNPENYSGAIQGFRDADVLISAAKPGSLGIDTINAMRKPSIVFALSNPTPEISLEQAKLLNIDIFGTGRSDYPNQINNSLCFPGFLRAILKLKVKKITDRMKIAAAEAIAETVKEPEKGRIVPDTFDRNIPGNIFDKMKKISS